VLLPPVVLQPAGGAAVLQVLPVNSFIPAILAHSIS
jgi:hypothetical protein